MADSRQPGAEAQQPVELLDLAHQATKPAYQDLLNDVSDVVLDSAPDGQLLSVNAAACELAGYPREELLALNIQQLFGRECLPALQALLVANSELEQLAPAEVRLVARGGERIHLQMKARVSRLNGRIASVRWIGRDVSALTRAHERIQYLEEQGRVVFQVTPDAVAINRLDDGTYLEVNEGFVESMGFTRADLIGVSSLHLGIWAHPAEREHLAALLARDGEVHNMEAQFRRKDGRVKPGLMSARITMLGGEPHILSVTRDLTSWNQARKALRESEAHLEHVQQFGQRLLAAIEHASDEVVIFDKVGVIQYCNPALLQRISHTREEVIGQSMLFLQSGREGEEFLERIAVTLREAKAWSGRLSSRRKDGALITEDATVSPIFGAMKDLIGVVVVFRDITRQLALEARLQQSQRLESVGRLAGGVAHDFNNLLTVINGYSGLLLMTLGEGEPARRQVAEIQKAGERAAQLTQQLLAFSRKQVTSPRPLSLNTVILEAQEMLSRVLGENTDLSVDLAPDLGLANSDPGQIHQILLNMAMNARDAMPSGGKFTIRTTNMEIDAARAALHPETKPGHFVSCVVSDTGTGIDPEIRPHIFEPFFTTKKLGKGTGLGLSTVYGIVQQNQGCLWVESEWGAGAVFTICLPRCTAEAIPETTPPAEEDPGGTETILIVEDQDEVRRLAAETLSRRGYRVITATSGEDALEQASCYADRIDLLLSDILMPGMSGRELGVRLRVERPGISVLLMTGHDPEVADNQGVADAGDEVLEKPFSTVALCTRIRSVLNAE